MKRKYISAALTLTLITGLTGCADTATPATVSAAEENYGNTEYSGVKSYEEYAGISAETDSSDVKTIKIAYGYSGYPISYTTNQGDASGYDIEILKAVDALLPEYRFEYVPSKGGDDLLLGVQSGKFNGAVRNWFQTEERRQIFSFPDKNTGLSVTGLTVRTAELDKIYDFATVSEAGGLLAPVDPGDGHYTVLKKWCDANPDKSWNFETGTIASSTDAFAWVAEGRYDAYFGLEVIFNRNVVDEEGPAHKYANDLSWTPCAAIPTYIIFSKEDKAVADALDTVIDQIWESGYPGYLQETLYGVNYIEQYGRDGLGFSK